MTIIFNVCLCSNKRIELAKIEQILNEINVGDDQLIIHSYSSREQMLFESEDFTETPDVLYIDPEMESLRGGNTAQFLKQMGWDSEVIYMSPETSPQGNDYGFNPFYVFPKTQLTKEEHQAILKAVLSKAVEKRKQQIVLQDGTSKKQIHLNGVMFFEINHRVVKAVCKNGSTVEFYQTISSLEKSLTDKHFVRTYRSHLVNFRCIDKIEQNQVVLCNGTVLPLGLSYKSKIKQDYYSTSPQIRDLD